MYQQKLLVKDTYLPEYLFQVQDVRPFTVTGVDFTGSLYVKRGSEKVKAYVCLFTCATSRAVI